MDASPSAIAIVGLVMTTTLARATEHWNSGTFEPIGGPGGSAFMRRFVAQLFYACIAILVARSIRNEF